MSSVPACEHFEVDLQDDQHDEDLPKRPFWSECARCSSEVGGVKKGRERRRGRGGRTMKARTSKKLQRIQRHRRGLRWWERGGFWVGWVALVERRDPNKGLFSWSGRLVEKSR